MVGVIRKIFFDNIIHGCINISILRKEDKFLLVLILKRQKSSMTLKILTKLLLIQYQVRQLSQS